MSDGFDDRRKALEEEYIRRNDQEALKKLRAQMDADKQAASALHCPRDGGALTEVMHDDVRLDRCSTCGGVWLDAGELDKLEHHETHGADGWASRLLASFRDE